MGGSGCPGPCRLDAVDAPVCGSFERLMACVRGLVTQERPVRDAVAGGVHAGHEAAPAGGTDRLRVGVREDHALLAQSLHVGRAVALVQESRFGSAVLFPPKGRDVSCQPMSSTRKRMMLGRFGSAARDAFTEAAEAEQALPSRNGMRKAAIREIFITKKTSAYNNA